MTPQRLFWMLFGLLAAVLAALLAVQALLFGWVHTAPLGEVPVKFRVNLVVFLALAFLTWLPVLAWVLWRLVQRYVVPWHRLRESIDAALQAEPGTAIPVEGGVDPEGLAEALNELNRRRELSESRVAEAQALAVEAISRERERLRAMLDRSGACVLACDTEGRITAYSRGAWERLGPAAGVGLGRPVDALVDPQLLLFAFDTLRQQAEAGVPAPAERFRIAEAGGRAWIVRAEPLREAPPGDVAPDLAGLVLSFDEAPAESEAPLAAPAAGRARRAGPAAETPLAELRFVVFDTETTGLHPSEGDEIVSLGAVAVAHGRVVQEEGFERWVDPGRPISPSAIRIHGIRPEQLVGKPRLAEVLPELARFAEGAVLVAHNAAFDMRFLHLKEAATGIRFDHPVLDTMLLSSVVHPHQRSHALDDLIARYGIARAERHSALGDALMTAEVLLKLLPLLAKRGITTLGQAGEASRRVPLAGLIY